jgi:[protein-PII] uridylyltransferase
VTLALLVEQVKKLDDMSVLSTWKTLVAQSYEWLEASFDNYPVEALVTGRATFIDKLLDKAWTLSGLADDDNLTLCAVGGYGRGHLQPYSDIDLLIVSQKKLSRETGDKVSQFITFLWDIKLDIGQAVRTVKDCVRQAHDDISIATNLVELRFLAGNQALYDALWYKVNQKHRWSSKQFFLAKFEEQKARHHKFHGTAYNLEPNIKENPGCLRDIQTIGWVAKQHFREHDGIALVGHGYMTESELNELVECRMHLWKIRFALHLIAGRSENRLLFDYQTDVAHKMGYTQDGKQSVEAMMRDFFRTVSRINELNQMLLRRFEADILNKKLAHTCVLSDDFELMGSLISPRREQVFDKPEKLLDFLKVIADNPTVEGLTTDCIRQLRNARRLFRPQYYYEHDICRKKFMELMCRPHFFDKAWDVMHEYKILQHYLPAWDLIVGLMQFDLFHAYTVDEHTHRLVKHVNRYFDPKDKRFPRCSSIVSGMDHPEILYMAAIFHDIAKGRNGDHSVLGEKEVLQFCKQHDVTQEYADMIAWLVRNHLLMSVVAQRRDIYDPEVVHEFASTVKSHEHLNLLYALTLADIRATNDNLWNDWKASLLKELYLMTQKALDNGLQCQRTLDERIANHKSQVLTLLAQETIQISDAEQLWKTLNHDYFSRFKPIQIAWHTQQILAHKALLKESLLVSVNNDTAKGGTEVLVYGKDRPALFAQIASVVDSSNCSIHDAHITVTNDGYVFNSLLLLNNDGQRLTSQARIRELEKAISEQLNKPGKAHTNTRRISRQMRHIDVPVKIRFFSPDQNSTLIELEALDAPGILAKIGHALVDQNVTLKLAKVSTIGERAEDVFIVENAKGKALTQEEQVALKQQLHFKLEQLEDIANS